MVRQLTLPQAFSDSPEQKMAVQFITDMMKERVGPEKAELAEKLIPTKFGFGCRYDGFPCGPSVKAGE